jgi:hypothetical protein
MTNLLDGNPVNAYVLDSALRTLGSICLSDHNPVILAIRGPLQVDEIKRTFTYSKVNWKIFQNYVLNTQWSEGNVCIM